MCDFGLALVIMIYDSTFDVTNVQKNKEKKRNLRKGSVDYSTVDLQIWKKLSNNSTREFKNMSSGEKNTYQFTGIRIKFQQQKLVSMCLVGHTCIMVDHVKIVSYVWGYQLLKCINTNLHVVRGYKSNNENLYFSVLF